MAARKKTEDSYRLRPLRWAKEGHAHGVITGLVAYRISPKGGRYILEMAFVEQAFSEWGEVERGATLEYLMRVAEAHHTTQIVARYLERVRG